MRRIRPHHGLCTLFFEGKGYSAAFVEGMGQVIREAEQGEVLRLTAAADEICQSCPNRRGTACSGVNALSYDREVLRRTGLREGDIITLNQLQCSVEEHILRPGGLEAICGKCRWFEICQRKWMEREPL